MDAVKSGKLSAQITSLVCDVEGAPVLEKAKRAGVKVHLVLPDMQISAIDPRRQEHEKRILNSIESEAADFLVLAGYMRILSTPLINAFASKRGAYSRIVNIHPSLLPAFPGVGGYAQAFRHGCRLAGATVHLVTSELDSGPICAQESFSIEKCASVEEVEKLGLVLEHRLYVETLGWVIREDFVLETRGDGPGRRFHVRKN